MPKTSDEQIDDFARIALQAGMARAAMTKARRDARDKGAAGTTAREVATKAKFKALERKLWALSDRIDWATAIKQAEKENT